jgi:hypothetical protein
MVATPMRWKSLRLHKFHLEGNGIKIALSMQNLSVWLSQGMQGGKDEENGVAT